MLLQAPNLDYAVRVGDIFSMIIEFQANKLRWKQVLWLILKVKPVLNRCFKKAYAAYQEMKEHMPESSIPYYVSPKLLRVMHKELNLDYKIGAPNSNNGNFEANNNNNYNDEDIRDDVAYGTYED